MPEVVVITGASSGIGRATVRRFAGPDTRLALIARNRAALEAARAEVEAAGGEALILPTDVADPDGVEAAAAATEEALGPIDIWINVAMTTVFAPKVFMRWPTPSGHSATSSSWRRTSRLAPSGMR